MVEVGGARKRKQSAPRKAFPQEKVAKPLSRDQGRYDVIGSTHYDNELLCVYRSAQNQDEDTSEVSCSLMMSLSYYVMSL